MKLKDLEKHGITKEWLNDPANWKKIKEDMAELRELKKTKTISGTIEKVEREIFAYQLIEKTLAELWVATIPYQMVERI